MKKLLYIILTACACLPVFPVRGDGLLSFSSPGPDRYADGSDVLDGEVYALVWTSNTCEFAGFRYDGTLVSNTDKLILSASVAKDGSCPSIQFRVPAETVGGLNGLGTYSVYLLDTRKTDSSLSGLMLNRYPMTVNGWTVMTEPAEPGTLGVSKTMTLAATAAAGARIDEFPRTRTWFVDSENGSDSNDGLTLKTALGNLERCIGKAGPGDQIIVEEGTYDGPFFVDKPLKIAADSRDPSKTRLVVGGGGVIKIKYALDKTNYAGTSVVQGFTVRGGNGGFRSANGDSYGGGIKTCETTRVVDCVIECNYGGTFGGGLSVEGADVVVFNCLIRNNAASYCENLLADHGSNVVLVDSTMANGTYAAPNYSRICFSNCVVNAAHDEKFSRWHSYPDWETVVGGSGGHDFGNLKPMSSLDLAGLEGNWPDPDEPVVTNVVTVTNFVEHVRDVFVTNRVTETVFRTNDVVNVVNLTNVVYVTNTVVRTETNVVERVKVVPETVYTYVTVTNDVHVHEPIPMVREKKIWSYSGTAYLDGRRAGTLEAKMSKPNRYGYSRILVRNFVLDGTRRKNSLAAYGLVVDGEWTYANFYGNSGYLEFSGDYAVGECVLKGVRYRVELSVVR